MGDVDLNNGVGVSSVAREVCAYVIDWAMGKGGEKKSPHQYAPYTKR